jgi:hypothetical protein
MHRVAEKCREGVFPETELPALVVSGNSILSTYEFGWYFLKKSSVNKTVGIQ